MSKKFHLVFLFCLIALPIIFLSCSNPVINTVTGEAMEWNLVGTTNEEIYSMAIGDANSFFYISSEGNFKNISGSKQRINTDATFRAHSVQAYNASYAVFFGLSYPVNPDSGKTYLQMYIIRGDTLSKISLALSYPAQNMNFIIESREHIKAVYGNIIYSYDKGTITKDSLNNQFVSSFFSLDNELYAFTYYTGNPKIYKYQAGKFNYLCPSTYEGFTIPMTNGVLKLDYGFLPAGLQYFNGNGFTNLASVDFTITAFAAYDKNNFYCTLDDSTGNHIGKIWNGTSFQNDTLFPMKNFKTPIIQTTNIRDNTLFVYAPENGMYYIYKGKRIFIY